MNPEEIIVAYEKELFKKNFISTSNKYKKLLSDYDKLIKLLVSVKAEESLINSVKYSCEQASSDFDKFLKDPDYDYQNRRLKTAQFSLQQAQKKANYFLGQKKI